MSEESAINELLVKWSGTEYKINGLCATDDVTQLKRVISEVTGVLPERQKLFGLKLNGT